MNINTGDLSNSSEVTLLGIPQNDEEYFNAIGLGTKAAIALSAMAKIDGFITADEYEALAISADLLAQQSENPLLIRVLILQGLLNPISFDRAISDVKQASKNQSEEIRKAVLATAIPLLNCQATAKQNKLTTKWLNSLELSPEFLRSSQEFTNSTVKTLFCSLKDLFSVKNNIDRLVERAEEIAETFKDGLLKKKIAILRKQQNEENLSILLTEIEAAAHRSLTAVEQLLPSSKIIEEQEKQANRLLQVTETLVEQLRNRLYHLNERLKVEHEMYREDINILIESTLDNIELGMRDLIAERKNWADETLWKQFLQRDASSKFRANLRQHENKYNKFITIWGHELSSFSKEIEKTTKTIRTSVDPIVFSGMVKTKHGAINLKNQLDSIADLTLGLHIAGAAITGILALVTQGAILASLTPAAPFAIPVILVTAGPAIIWKMFSNPEKRKRQVIQDKREQMRNGLIEVLGNPIKKHEETCEGIFKQYLEIASKYYAPLVRDARLAVLQAKLEAKVIALIKDDTNKLFKECIDTYKASKGNLLDMMYQRATEQYQKISHVIKLKKGK